MEHQQNMGGNSELILGGVECGDTAVGSHQNFDLAPKQPESVVLDKGEKKKRADKKYREKIKRQEVQTEATLKKLEEDVKNLTEENEKLEQARKERDYIKESEEKSMDELRKQCSDLEKSHQTQSLMLRKLEEDLAGSSYDNIQRKNATLKCELSLLERVLDNPDEWQMPNLEQKHKDLRKRKRGLKMTVEALSNEAAENKRTRKNIEE